VLLTNVSNFLSGKVFLVYLYITKLRKLLVWLGEIKYT